MWDCQVSCSTPCLENWEVWKPDPVRNDNDSQHHSYISTCFVQPDLKESRSNPLPSCNHTPLISLHIHGSTLQSYFCKIFIKNAVHKAEPPYSDRMYSAWASCFATREGSSGLQSYLCSSREPFTSVSIFPYTKRLDACPEMPLFSLHHWKQFPKGQFIGKLKDLHQN